MATTKQYFFFLTRQFGDTHRLMYEKSISFVYVFVIICRFFEIIRPVLCLIKLKIGMPYHMSNTYQYTMY